MEVGLVYTGQCHLFCGESFSEDEVVNKSDSGASQQLLCSFNASHSRSSISITMEAAKYTRLFVEDSEGTICSDSISRQTFYQFLDTSKYLATYYTRGSGIQFSPTISMVHNYIDALE